MTVKGHLKEPVKTIIKSRTTSYWNVFLGVYLNHNFIPLTLQIPYLEIFYLASLG